MILCCLAKSCALITLIHLALYVCEICVLLKCFVMEDQIRNFIAEITFNNPSLIKNDTLIFDEGIFDSMGLLSLINHLESEYNVFTEDSELQEENFGSVEKIVAFISQKQKVAS